MLGRLLLENLVDAGVREFSSATLVTLVYAPGPGDAPLYSSCGVEYRCKRVSTASAQRLMVQSTTPCQKPRRKPQRFKRTELERSRWDSPKVVFDSRPRPMAKRVSYAPGPGTGVELFGQNVTVPDCFAQATERRSHKNGDGAMRDRAHFGCLVAYQCHDNVVTGF
jgi:hypothetical protein